MLYLSVLLGVSLFTCLFGCKAAGKLTHCSYRFEAGEEATEGRVAERLPPPATEAAAPEAHGNKLETDVKPEEVAAKPEPMDAKDGPQPQTVGADARQADAAALPAPMDPEPTAAVAAAAARLPPPGAVAPIQFGAFPAAPADGAAPPPPAGELAAAQAAPAPAAALAAMSQATGAQGVGNVPAVAPGSILPPAVAMQGQPAAPVAQAPDPNHPPLAGGETAAAAAAPPSETPQPPAAGQAPGSGAV